jgi:pyridoxamine 5'-phosphate oxidase family protein
MFLPRSAGRRLLTMTTFTSAEIEFLDSHRTGSLATVGADGMPHVVPVAVFYDQEADALVIGANVQFGEARMIRSKKFRDAQRHPNVTVMVDSGPSYLEVRGQAKTHLEGGEDVSTRLDTPFRFAPAWISIHPRRIVAMGVNGTQFEISARDVA